MKPRGDFHLHLFDKLWDDINTNVKAIWLLITVLLLGSFATVIFTKANIAPMITTYSLVVVSIIWIMAHISSAGHWFNNTLLFIANIEKQFLNDEETESVHLYFARHRLTRIEPHFWLQHVFLIILTTFLLIFYTSKIPYDMIFYNHTFSIYLLFYLIPFFITIAGTIFLIRFKKTSLGKTNVTHVEKSPIARTLDWFDIAVYMLIIFLLVMIIFFYTARYTEHSAPPLDTTTRFTSQAFNVPQKGQLVLNGVMLSEQGRIALINNKVFHVGDEVEGMWLVKIAFNGVKLQNGNQILILRTNSY